MLTNDVYLAVAAGKMFPTSYLMRRAGGDLTTVLALQGVAPLSRAALGDALEGDPFAVDLLMNYGLASMIDGAPESARRAFTRAVTLDPQVFLPRDLRRTRGSVLSRRTGDSK